MKTFFSYLLITFILLPHMTLAKVDEFTLRPTMSTYEYLCQTQHMTPVSGLGNICNVVVKSEVCRNVPKKDLLKCNDIEKTQQLDAWEFIKGCAGGVFNSVKDLLDFFWEIMKWAWDNTTSSEARGKTSQQAREYLSSAKLYLNTEYQKAYAKSSPPMREMKAVGTMTGAMGKMILNAITDTVQKNYREFGCLNFEAKSEHICKLVGDILIPPAGFVAFLKYGPQAVKQFPNLKKLYAKDKPKAQATAPRPQAPVTYPTKAFAELAAKYPELAKTYEKIGKNLPMGAAPVTHPRDIRYDLTTGFRAVSPEEMLKRAETLEPEHAKSVVAAYNALNDKQMMKSYMEKLIAESAEWMAKKGRPEDIENLKKGIVTEQAIAVTLVKRLKDRGDLNFTTISRKKFSTGKIEFDPDEIKSPNDKFRAAVRTGPFFDNAFPVNTKGGRQNHGRYTHMLQRDMIAGALNKSTGGNPQKFWDFMGTKKGINYWVDLFDSENRNSFTRPEVISEFLNHNVTERRFMRDN